MLDDLAPVLILFAIGYFTLELVKVVSENRLRHKLIEKGMVDEKAQLLFSKRLPAPSASSLKWGIVLIAVGPAFMFAYAIHAWVPPVVREEIMAGAVFFMAGLGMIVDHAIARRQDRDE